MGVKQNDLKNIDNIFDLITYVTELNNEIRQRNLENPDGKQEKELNLSYILKRYEKIKKKEEIKQFRELHECKYCLYFDKPRRCMAIDSCPIEGEFETSKKEEKPVLKCPKYDQDKTCPYANETGTCFGYCVKEVMKEIKKNRSSSQKDGEAL
ncbi:MAG: hypothetical protein J6M65_11115 [Eubacterium sp.]|nr:hypothetical protein [Eubacterium sp.]